MRIEIQGFAGASVTLGAWFFVLTHGYAPCLAPFFGRGAETRQIT